MSDHKYALIKVSLPLVKNLRIEQVVVRDDENYYLVHVLDWIEIDNPNTMDDAKLTETVRKVVT